MKTAGAEQVIMPEMVATDDRIRWFSDTGCVVRRGKLAEVFVAGTLIGRFSGRQVGVRNLVLVGLAQDPKIRKGELAKAFGLGAERLRRIRAEVQAFGVEALPQRPRGGRESIASPTLRKRLATLFEAGMSASAAHRECGGDKAGVSSRTVCRLRRQWQATQQQEGTGQRARASQVQLELVQTETAPPPSETDAGVAVLDDGGAVAAQHRLPPHDPVQVGGCQHSAETDSDPSDDGLLGCGATAGPRSGRGVQHAGSWLLLAVVHLLGLHAAVLRPCLKKKAGDWLQRLRVAIDAVVLALGIGQRCVEGVRRLQTPSGATLLRSQHVPSASWTRRMLKNRLKEGDAFWIQLSMTQCYLQRSRDDAAAVFYVDNHLRPYTGKHTVRKGWRMQDKRVRPGTSDYYVHDEDGRPVWRFAVPCHDSLSAWMLPVISVLQTALGRSQRIVLAFDRGGAYPEQLARLRNEGIEFVTYERRPYPLLSATAFTEHLVIDDERIGIAEPRNKNLGRGRGRVRRIALRMPDGRQINLLAVSQEPASRLVEIITGRWVQENGFKHGNERWGINQLDGRQVQAYPPHVVIPNPARRRLDHALRLARHREGDARRRLARLDDGDPRRQRAESDLRDALAEQHRLEALRPQLPKRAPLDQTELKDKLVYHPTGYKTLLDTIRIACANAESELAALLAPHLRKPAEAKKVLANLFAAPADIRVNGNSITVSLTPAANAAEHRAIAELFCAVNRVNLTLPGDPKQRPLRFRSQLS